MSNEQQALDQKWTKSDEKGGRRKGGRIIFLLDDMQSCMLFGGF